MSFPSFRLSALCALMLCITGLIGCGNKKELNFVGTGCPNGQVDTGETCDDNNRSAGDGCSAACQEESGWSCSGTPSLCVRCGNSKLEGSEGCDDGNATDGDGCSSHCEIEGSCDTPVAIPLTAATDGDGLVGRASSATGAIDTPQVAKGNCAGTSTGDGPDRIFEVELLATADLEVSLTASFDAVVRVMTSPCTLTDQVAGGCSASATTTPFAVPSLAPGKYYIVVDSTASAQAGPFRIDVAARCPLENVKIDRVVLQAPYRTHILNTNQDCSVKLSRIGIYSKPEATDTPSLPDQLLPALGRRILSSENPVPAGQTYQGNIPYDTDGYAGAFYLCRGVCDTTSGANVYDAFRWRGTAGAAPAGPTNVTFDADKPALDNRLLKSYYRVQTAGKYPAFKAADYVPAYFVDTFEDGALEGWTPGAATFYTAAYEAPTGTIGNLALALTGGNPTATVWNGPKVVFEDNSGAPMRIQPTSVSLWVRASTATNLTLSFGQVFFGIAGNEAGAFGSMFRDSASSNFGFGSPTVTITQPSYTAGTWYQIDYKAINWTASTADVYVNGTKYGTLNMAAQSVEQLNLRSLADTTFWVDQIIVN